MGPTHSRKTAADQRLRLRLINKTLAKGVKLHCRSDKVCPHLNEVLCVQWKKKNSPHFGKLLPWQKISTPQRELFVCHTQSEILNVLSEFVVIAGHLKPVSLQGRVPWSSLRWWMLRDEGIIMPGMLQRIYFRLEWRCLNYKTIKSFVSFSCLLHIKCVKHQTAPPDWEMPSRMWFLSDTVRCCSCIF